MVPIIMIVFTLKREVHAIVDEYQDWSDEGLDVLFHRTTSKCHDAFIVIKWHKPIPERFVRKLLEDASVMDYLIFDAAKIRPIQA